MVTLLCRQIGQKEAVLYSIFTRKERLCYLAFDLKIRSTIYDVVGSGAVQQARSILCNMIRFLLFLFVVG